MNIWIWGSGKIATEMLNNGVNGKIEGIIETRKTKKTFWDYPVINAEDIPQDFDYIFVANQYADEIYDWCVNVQLDINRIIFLVKGKKTNNYFWQDLWAAKKIRGVSLYQVDAIFYGKESNEREGHTRCMGNR